MDNFEKHISENRALFDEHKADRAKLWANIEAGLIRKEPKLIRFWKSPMTRIAASILIVLGIFGIIGITVSGNTDESSATPISRELGEIDMYYQNLISFQIKLVNRNPNLSEEDKTEFLSFMDELDEEYTVLRLELDKNLDNQLVLEAIIANYKKRIELIEKLLKQINDSKLIKEDYGYTL